MPGERIRLDHSALGPVVVRKYGSSLLTDERAIPFVVQDIAAELGEGRRVVAVTSAFAGETDRLLALWRAVGASAEGDDLAHDEARFVASGEERSAQLLALSLRRHGVAATALRVADVGLRTSGDPRQAAIDEVRPAAIRAALGCADVVVVPGFAGTHADGRVALLGRGGSDLTAIRIAAALVAPCRLVKDVPGIWATGGGGADGSPRKTFAALSWSEASRLAGKAIQPGAARAAHRLRFRYEVGGPLGGPATTIGPSRRTQPLRPAAPPRRIRVALLGCGHVGRGVYERLGDLRARFELVGVAVRDIDRHVAAGVDRALLDTDPGRIAARGEIVIEALGGVEPARRVIAETLADGRTVVSANKEVLAAHGETFAGLVDRHGGRLLAGGAVGGAAPCLELVARCREEGVESFAGVLNGTSNVVLEAIAGGQSRRAAIAAAQAAGFAEADPSRDLAGLDAAAKLVLLCRAAWGAEPSVIERDDLRLAKVAELREPGRRWRQVASARRTRRGILAAVRLEPVDSRSPFYELSGAWNRLVVRTRAGAEHVAQGQGAGRWPTTLAVIRDLLIAAPSVRRSTVATLERTA